MGIPQGCYQGLSSGRGPSCWRYCFLEAGVLILPWVFPRDVIKDCPQGGGLHAGGIASWKLGYI